MVGLLNRIGCSLGICCHEFKVKPVGLGMFSPMLEFRYVVGRYVGFKQRANMKEEEWNKGIRSV